MSIPAVVLCVAGGVAVAGGLILAERFEKAATFALIGGCVAMWVAFWGEALT